MAPSRKTGSPRTKLTPKVQEIIVSAIRAGNYTRVAAEYAGINEATLYRWLQRGREARRGRYRNFWEAVQKADRESEVRAVAIMQKHMQDYWQAAMTFLERKYPERWGRRDHLRIETNPREALAELLDVSPEGLEEAIEAMARKS